VKKNLVLLGMMAVGKTTLGKIVAKKQEMEFIDIDLTIEKKNSMTINEIFKEKGEAFFRLEEEKEVLKSLKQSNCVIALGGGAFMNSILRENILKNAVSFWLDDDLETLEKRLKSNKKRPLLNEENNEQKIKKIYLERKSIYQLANNKITCDGLSKEDIADQIISLYEKY
tara:strand:+ start:1553 stop:2062 length:510 start_codon:yes stop_codon:yes gene_type:complete